MLEVVIVFHEVEKFGPVPVTAEPKLTPSTWNCTEAMPTVELAFAVSVTVPLTAPAVGAVTLTVGGTAPVPKNTPETTAFRPPVYWTVMVT